MSAPTEDEARRAEIAALTARVAELEGLKKRLRTLADEFRAQANECWHAETRNPPNRQGPSMTAVHAARASAYESAARRLRAALGDSHE